MEIIIVFVAAFGSALWLMRQASSGHRAPVKIQDPEAWRKNVNTNWSKW